MVPRATSFASGVLLTLASCLIADPAGSGSRQGRQYYRALAEASEPTGFPQWFVRDADAVSTGRGVEGPAGGRRFGGGTDDLGDAWVVSPSVRVDRDNEGFDGARAPCLRAGPNGELAAVWMQGYPDLPWVWCAYSLDQGATWSEPEQVNPGSDWWNYALYPMCDFTPSGELIVVWDYIDQPDGSFHTYFRKRSSVFGPAVWSDARRIQQGWANGGEIQYPTILAIDDLRYVMTWTDFHSELFDQVYFRRTDDGGLTWSADLRVSNAAANQEAEQSSIVVDRFARRPGAETIYVATSDWRNSSFPNVYAYRSTDGGATWNAGSRVNDVTAGFQTMYREGLVQTADGTLCAIWDNDSPVGVDLRASQSLDGGDTWTPGIIVNPDAVASSVYSFACAEGNRVVIGWSGNLRSPLAGDQMYARVSDAVGALELGGVIQLSDVVFGEDESPRKGSCDLYEGAVVAAWYDSRPGPWAVYCSRATQPLVDVPVGDATSLGGRGIVIYPNPAVAGKDVQVMTAPGWEVPGTAVLEIFDLRGRLVAGQEVRRSGAGSAVVGVLPRGMPSAMYFLRLRGGGASLPLGRISVVR